MFPVVSSQDAYRRSQARRSTLAGVGGIILLALGIILTLAQVGGNVLPTILALVGAGSLLAGVSTGSAALMDSFRMTRKQSSDDD